MSRPRFSLGSLVVLAMFCVASPLLAEEGDVASGMADDAFPWLGGVNGHDVRLRAGPSANHRVLELLDREAVVVVLRRTGESDQWFEVRVPGGVPAWVREDLIAIGDGDQAKVTRTAVLMRPTAGQDYLPLNGRLDRDEMVRVLERKKGESGQPGWAKIIAPSRVLAYVHSDFVRRTGPVPADLSDVVAKRASRLVDASAPEGAEKKADEKDDLLRQRIEKVRMDVAAMLAGDKAEWSFGPARAELEDVLSQVETDATKLLAAELYRDILVSEKDLELHRARTEAELTEKELREQIRLADERYREQIERLSRFAPAPETKYVAIGWVRKRGDDWIIEKGTVALYALVSKRFDIEAFAGKRVGVGGKVVGESPLLGARVLEVTALEIFPRK